MILYHPITFQFSRCHLDYWPTREYLETVFEDGSRVEASPMDDLEYRATAGKLGYGRDVMRMCLHHEFIHSLRAEILGLPYSQVLWDVAHGIHGDEALARDEEAAVLRLQKLLVVNESAFASLFCAVPGHGWPPEYAPGQAAMVPKYRHLAGS